MKDNKYPEYEDHTGMCCESSPTQAAISNFGPSSDEEAIERIALFEDKYSKGQVNWTSSEEFDKQLFEEFPWLCS